MADRDKALAADVALAAETAEAVRQNLRAGRPFYEPVPEAFRARFQRNYKGLYNYVNRHPAMPAFNEKGERVGGPKSGDPDRERTARAVVNKTFYNALRGIAGYRGEAPLTAWFYTIAHNALVDELRTRTRIPAVRDRARSPWAEERFDATTDDDAGRSMKLLLQATQTMAARSGEVEVGQRAAMLGRMLADLRDERDQYGARYVSPRVSAILAAYAQASFDFGAMARILGVSELTAGMKARAALSELAAARSRMNAARGRAGQEVIAIVDWTY